MKKIVSLILVLVILCSMASVACAQASLTLIDTLDGDYQYVSGTNLLRKNVGYTNTYYLYTLNGEQVTDVPYKGLYSSKSYLEIVDPTVEDINCNGLLDLEGTLAIPCQYGVVKILSNEWILAMVLVDSTSDNYDFTSNNKTNYYIIDHVDVYHMPEGVVATLARSQYIDAAAVYHCINIQDRATGVISTYDASFNLLGSGLKYTSSGEYATPDYSFPRENGRCAIIDAAGNVIFEPSFGTVYDLKGDYFMVSNDSFYGIVSKNGEVIIEPAYERIQSNYQAPYSAEFGSLYNAGEYFAVIKDGKMGYVDMSGNITCEPKYSKDIMDNNGASATLTDLTGNTILVAADGVETILPSYSNLYAMSFGSGFFYRVKNENYQEGLIDWHGNVILPMEYDNVSFTGDGQYCVARKNASTEIYVVTYPGQAEVQDEAQASTGLSSLRQNLQNAILGDNNTQAPADPAVDTPEDVPADAPVEDTVDNSSSIAMLTGAVTLLNTDAAANKDAALALINTAAVSLTSNANVSSLLTSAIELLNADAAANTVSCVTLLNTAISML